MIVKVGVFCMYLERKPITMSIDHIKVLNRFDQMGQPPPELDEAVVDLDVKPVLGGLYHIYERHYCADKVPTTLR